MKTKIESLKITDDVVYVNDVIFYREAPDLTKAKKVLEKWQWIKDHVCTEMQKAQELYDHMKDRGLSLNLIETEGYLRAIKDVQDQLEHIDEIMGQ